MAASSESDARVEYSGQISEWLERYLRDEESSKGEQNGFDVGKMNDAWLEDRKKKLLRDDLQCRHEKCLESMREAFGDKTRSDNPRSNRNEKLKDIVNAFKKKPALFRMAKFLQKGPMNRDDLLGNMGYKNAPNGGNGGASKTAALLRPFGIAEEGSTRDPYKLSALGREAIRIREREIDLEE